MKHLALVLGLFAAACCLVPKPHDGGVTFEFVHASHNETFRARTSDPQVIASLRAELAKPADQRTLHPHGALQRGDDHGINGPWHWSYVEGDWRMGEISAEVCDGWPSDVEERLDAWMHVGSFCPWSSRVARELPN